MTQDKKLRPDKRYEEHLRLVADNRNLAKALQKNAARYLPESGQLVVLDAARYDELIARLEDLTDEVFAHRDAKAELEETVPFEMVKRIGAGESPVRVWREHRGLKAGMLADFVEISPAYLSDIERGKKDGSLAVMARIADMLGVLVDDLVPANMRRTDETVGENLD